MFLISLTWYSCIALLISDRRTQPHFLRLQPIIQGTLGVLLLGLGGRFLLSSR
jgi:threonine/homoserine/homoserine lactone efflux protein